MSRNNILGMMAFMMSASIGGEKDYPVNSKQKESDPEYKRKKCKLCSKFIKQKYGTCSHPNNQACSSYSKRK